MSYDADCRAGGAVSCGYDIAADMWAAFAWPHMSVTPPGSTATFRGLSKLTNAVFCAEFSVMVR